MFGPKSCEGPDRTSDRILRSHLGSHFVSRIASRIGSRLLGDDGEGEEEEHQREEEEGDVAPRARERLHQDVRAVDHAEVLEELYDARK